jgi:hypothetical protein
MTFPDYQFVIAGALSQDFLLPKFHTANRSFEETADLLLQLWH